MLVCYVPLDDLRNQTRGITQDKKFRLSISSVLLLAVLEGKVVCRSSQLSLLSSLFRVQHRNGSCSLPVRSEANGVPPLLQAAAQAVAVSPRAAPRGCTLAAWRISSHSVTYSRLSVLQNKRGDEQI